MSSAAVVIGALRVNHMVPMFSETLQREATDMTSFAFLFFDDRSVPEKVGLLKGRIYIFGSKFFPL